MPGSRISARDVHSHSNLGRCRVPHSLSSCCRELSNGHARPGASDFESPCRGRERDYYVSRYNRPLVGRRGDGTDSGPQRQKTQRKTCYCTVRVSGTDRDSEPDMPVTLRVYVPGVVPVGGGGGGLELLPPPQPGRQIVSISRIAMPRRRRSLRFEVCPTKTIPTNGSHST